MSNIQVHFWILKVLLLQLKSVLSGLGYSKQSEFFRDTARQAVKKGKMLKSHNQRAPRVNRKGDLQGRRGQIVAKALRGKVVEVHFNISEDLWRRLLAVLPFLGYSSASEFFRDKIWEAISKRANLPV